MLSLSVLWDRAAGHDEVGRAIAAAGLGQPAFEEVEQEGLAGQLAWLTVGGVEVGLLVVAAPLPREELADALGHSGWQEGEFAIGTMKGHARIFAPGDEESALARLVALSHVAEPLVGLPGALALLDEPGHALTPAEVARGKLAQLGGPKPPLELWIAVRRFGVADAAGASFLDTLGMEQLGLPDLEAYAGAGRGADEMAGWLRNLALYLVQDGPPLRSGDTLDGPDGEPWRAQEDGATAPPPRKVLRFAPCGEPVDE